MLLGSRLLAAMRSARAGTHVAAAGAAAVGIGSLGSLVVAASSCSSGLAGSGTGGSGVVPLAVTGPTQPRHGRPTLVLVHGLDSSRKTWASFIAASAGRYNIIAVDQRGHGDSAMGDEAGYCAAAVVGDIRAALHEHDAGKKVVLLGHSMGGKIAMAYAAAHPDQIEALVRPPPLSTLPSPLPRAIHAHTRAPHTHTHSARPPAPISTPPLPTCPHLPSLSALCQIIEDMDIRNAMALERAELPAAEIERRRAYDRSFPSWAATKAALASYHDKDGKAVYTESERALPNLTPPPPAAAAAATTTTQCCSRPPATASQHPALSQSCCCCCHVPCLHQHGPFFSSFFFRPRNGAFGQGQWRRSLPTPTAGNATLLPSRCAPPTGRIDSWVGDGRVYERLDRTWWSGINPLAQWLALRNVLGRVGKAEWSELAAHRFPVTVFVAGRGSACDDASLAEMQALVPRAAFVKFADAGHSIHNADVPEFVEAVEAVYRSIEAGVAE